MARDAKTVGATFLKEILGKLPADQRAQAEALFSSAEAAGAVELLGNGSLRQSEFSTLMNELAEKTAANDKFKADLDTWRNERLADLTELGEWREGKRTVAGGGNPNPPNPNPQPPAIDPTKVVSPETLRQQMDDQERGAVGFFVELNDISMQHLKEFGEILNTRELVTHKDAQRLGIRGVYQLVHKDQIEAKAAATTKAREDALRAEGAAAERQRLAATNQPFPVTGSGAEGSSLDAIEAARSGQTPQHASIEQMSQEYARLGSVRAGTGA